MRTKTTITLALVFALGGCDAETDAPVPALDHRTVVLDLDEVVVAVELGPDRAVGAVHDAVTGDERYRTELDPRTLPAAPTRAELQVAAQTRADWEAESDASFRAATCEVVDYGECAYQACPGFWCMYCGSLDGGDYERICSDW